MRKDADSCFLCGRPGKARRYVFYSGVMKGGTTHRLLSCTVTFFERWSELTLHELGVCRECQLRLWRQRWFLPMVLCGSGSAAMMLIALAGLVLFSGVAQFAAVALPAFGALALGGLFVFLLIQYQAPKPKQAQIEPLILWEALDHLPYPEHTYLTSEQYLERHEKGLLG
jgi:hypothetical protein